MSTTPDQAPLHKRLEALAQAFAEQAWKDPKAANSAFLQDHAYSLNEFAQQAERDALADGDSMTVGQQVRIARLLADGHVTNLAIAYKPFDLPEGWIAVTVTYTTVEYTTGPIYGGISPEGDMHT